MDGPTQSSSSTTSRKSIDKHHEAGAVKSRRSRAELPPNQIVPKNASGRPDPFHWPTLTHAEAKNVESMLYKYKKEMAKYRNSSWLNSREYDYVFRPVPSKQPLDAFIYGMSACFNAVQKGLCWAVIVEGQVTPRSIILPIVEECVYQNIPMVCLNDLRRTSVNNFGLLTDCLGIRKGSLPMLRKKIATISDAYKAAQLQLKQLYSKRTPKQKEPAEIIVENLFDLNPVDTSENDKKQLHEYDGPSTSQGVSAIKTHCPDTVTSKAFDVGPSPNTFRMVLKKTSRHSEPQAWLDIDKKEIVVIPH